MIDQYKVIVSGFVFNDKGELLVIRRSMEEETFPGMLAIPGGTVESSPGSGLSNDVVEQNLIREIAEETGVPVEVGEWLGSSTIVSDKAKLYMFFKCSATRDVTPTTSPETPEVFWAKKESISLSECTPALKDYLTNNARR